MKKNELLFINFVLNKQDTESIRELIHRIDIPYKQCWYYLNKWCAKGYYEYGVTLDLGWLTKAGKYYFEELLNNENIH